MTRKERAKREWENLRNDIIDAAEQLFFSKGYEKVTMDDIVKKAELSKSTLYVYIKSKEELFLLVHLRGLKKRQAMMETLDEEESGYERLRAFGREYYSFYETYPEYLRLQLYWSAYGVNFSKISSSVIEEFREENEKALATLRRAFQSELEDTRYGSSKYINRLVSHFLQTLRIVLNQSLLPVDPFQRYNDPDYYFQYLDLFMLSIKAMKLLGTKNGLNMGFTPQLSMDS